LSGGAPDREAASKTRGVARFISINAFLER
jgi:hypothetical protein